MLDVIALFACQNEPAAVRGVGGIGELGIGCPV
jgi:hypothetical protein